MIDPFLADASPAWGIRRLIAYRWT